MVLLGAVASQPWPFACSLLRLSLVALHLGHGLSQRQARGPWAAHSSPDKLERGRAGKATEADTHLSPDQLPNTNKQAPEPLFRRQRGAAEGLSAELHDDNLRKRGGREARPASSSSPRGSPCPVGPAQGVRRLVASPR